MSLKKALLILLILILNSCSSVTKSEKIITVPNVYACVDYDEVSGLCGKTTSKEKGYMTGDDWNKYKRRSIKFTPEGYSQIKAVILKLCNITQSCVFQEIQIK